MTNRSLIKNAMAKMEFSLAGKNPALVPLDHLSLCETILKGGVNTLPFFATMVLKAPLDEVAIQYAEWVLGKGPYDDMREQYVLMGLDWNLGVEDLYPRETTIVNESGQIRNLEIWTRKTEDGWLLRYRIWGGVTEPGIEKEIFCLWTHVVRLRDVGAGEVKVEHALQLTVPPREKRRPHPGPPMIVMDLFEKVLIPAFKAMLQRAKGGEREHEIMVREILDPDRIYPILLLVPCCGGSFEDGLSPIENEPLLEEGLAGVAYLRVIPEETLPSPMAGVREVMRRNGIPEHLMPPEGGARLYMPGFSPRDAEEDHRTWSPTFFQRNPSPNAERIMGAEVAALAAEFLIPKGFLNLVQAHDAHRLEMSLKPVGEKPEKSQQAVAPVTTLIADLRAQVDEFARVNELLTGENRRLEGRLVAEGSRADDLEYRLQGLMNRRTESKNPREDTQGLETAMEAALGGTPTLEEALLYFQHLFPSRIVVLPSALASARESEEFRYRSQSFRLLRILATDYWRALNEGSGGDTKARQVFGNNAYSAQESETASTNAVARAQRTVVYKGRSWFMRPHLRIGVGEGEGETLRIHFDWDPEDRLIVIGHCGRHLDHR